MQQRVLDPEGLYVYGSKPVWTDEEIEIEDSKIFWAINWYSYKYGKSDIKNILIKYFEVIENTKKYTQQIKQYDENKIMSSVAWICDMILNGLILVDSKSLFLDKIEDIKNNPKKFKRTEEVSIIEKPKKVSPMLRVQKYSEKIISNIDQEIDNFVMNEYQTNFNVKEYSKSVKPIYGKIVSQNYENLLKELQMVINREDPDLEESYSFLKRVELKRYFRFIKEIVDVFNSLKVVRKRKKIVGKKKTNKKNKQEVKIQKPKTKADKQLKKVSITDFM